MYVFDPGAPFGGNKNSGIGRENGPEGIEQYCEAKSMLLRSVTRPRASAADGNGPDTERWVLSRLFAQER